MLAAELDGPMQIRRFEKEDTLLIKGIAVAMMLIHHVLFFEGRLNADMLPVAFVPIMDTSLAKYIAGFCQVCVSLFIFLSGFGLMRSCTDRPATTVIKHLKKIYLSLWKVFVVFIPIGFLLFSHQGDYATDKSICDVFASFDLRTFVSNFLGMSFEYNGEWWFIKTYIIALLTFPVARMLIKKTNGFWCGLLALGAYDIVVGGVVPALAEINQLLSLQNNLIYSLFVRTASPYFVVFYSGMFFAHNGNLEHMRETFCELRLMSAPVAAISLFILSYLRGYVFGSGLDPYMIPILVIMLKELVRRPGKTDRILVEMGGHSTTMWLTHSFFCYYFGFFQGLILAPRWAPLVAMWFIIFDFTFAVMFDRAWAIVQSAVRRRLFARES